MGGIGGAAAPAAALDSSVVSRELLILISLVVADQRVGAIPSVRDASSEHLGNEILQRLAFTATVLRARDDVLVSRLAGIGDAERAELDLLRAESCGSLQADINNPATVNLTLREACNKILHATQVRFDVEGNDPMANYLNPKIYLYGSLNGDEWRAVLDLERYVEVGMRNAGLFL